VHQLAAERPRRLIETLACDIADCLMAQHALDHVSVEVEKHILPETDAVVVRTTRSR
jgi:dihydroneopterin aldolase